MRRDKLIGLCVLAMGLGCTALRASTIYVYGTIESVDHSTKRYVVRQETCNYPDRGEGQVRKYGYATDSRGRKRMLLLDGEPARAEDALVVGRGVCVRGHVTFVSSTCAGPDADAQVDDPQNGIYVIDMGWGAIKQYPAVYQGTEKLMDGDLYFVVDVVDGAVRSGRAISTRASKKPFQDADFSGLVIRDGAISGTVAVEFQANLDPNTGSDRLYIGPRVKAAYTLDAALKSGAITGSYTGRFGDAELSGRIGGRLAPRKTVPESGKVLMRVLNDETGTFGSYVFFEYEKGVPTSPGLWLHYKGSPFGEIKKNSLSVTSSGIKGTIVARQAREDKDYTVTIDAEWIGNRWVLAPVTFEIDGKVIPAQIRAIATPEDSALHAYTPDIDKQYKAYCAAGE